MPLFNIKCNNGTTVSVEAELTCKVLDFKELISPKVDVPAAQQRLIYSGKVLTAPRITCTCLSVAYPRSQPGWFAVPFGSHEL